MEIQLKKIIQKIKQALIPEKEKEKLYTAVLAALEATVYPILVKQMPQDKVQEVLQDKSKLTVDVYVGLIDTAMQTEGTSALLEVKLQQLFNKINEILVANNIA